MNRPDDQLNRLFRAAAQVQPALESPAFGLETRALAAWRESHRARVGFWDMSLLVRGLVVAGVITAVSFWPALNTVSNPFADFLQLTDSTIPSRPQPMSAQVKPWLVLAVIFIAGVLSGVALTVGLLPHFSRPPGEAQMKTRIMARYMKDLNLTPDQQAKISPILSDAATKAQAIHHDEIDKVSQIFKVADEQVSAFLTPEQKALLQKMEIEREKMFLSHGHPHGANHGGPPDVPFHGGPAPGPRARRSAATTSTARTGDECAGEVKGKSRA